MSSTERVLEHISSFGIGVRPILDVALFSARRDASNEALRRLRESGLLWSPRDYKERLPGGITYYILSPQGAALLKLPESAATKPGPRALDSRLSLLWYSLMAKRRAKPASGEALARLFGGTIPEVISRRRHLVEVIAAGSFVLQAYTPDVRSSVRSISRRVERLVTEARADPSVCRWIEAAAYRFAVFLDEPVAKKRVKTAIAKASILKLAKVNVRLAPRARSLKRYLEES